MCRQQASVYRLRVRGWTECQVLHRQQLRIPHVATEGQNSKALHIKHAILQFIYAANNNKPAILCTSRPPSCNEQKYHTAFILCM